MFLETISDAELLDADELYVLRRVPASTTRPLAKEMLQHLLQKDTARVVDSKEHIEWVMQITGHAFSLPIRDESDEKILSNAIYLYSKWMAFATMPDPIAANALYFTKKMCCHLSFIFKNRSISLSSPLFEAHVNLCRRVLTLYSRTARCPPKGMDSIQWNEYLTRIFLGICAEVMKGVATADSLGSRIEQDLFFCFFDVWMRSQTQNHFLWDTLKRMANAEWSYRGWFIESWGRCCAALTRRLIYMLYGGDNGSSCVFVSWPLIGTSSISISAMLTGRGSLLAPTNLPEHDIRVAVPETPYAEAAKFRSKSSSVCSSARPEQMITRIFVDDPRLLVFLWKKMLNLLNPKSIQDGECLGITMAWISRIVDMLMRVSHNLPQRRSGILPPGGNSVLRVFAKHLFTAAHMKAFENASAVALGALCRVFCGKCDTQWQDTYVMNFLSTLKQQLLRLPRRTLHKAHEQVIEHGSILFACDFSGARALIPYFLPHIEMALQRPHNSRLRLAAITMLCSLVCLEAHFFGSKTTLPSTRKKLPEVLKKAHTTMDVEMRAAHIRSVSKRGKAYDLLRGEQSIDLVTMSEKRSKTPKASSTTTSEVRTGASGTLAQTRWKHILAAEDMDAMQSALSAITSIVEDAFQTETCEYNIQKLCWLVAVLMQSWVTKATAVATSSPGRLVQLVWSWVKRETGLWQFRCVQTAFEMLQFVLPLHAAFLSKGESIFGHRFLGEMCTYAKEHMGKGGQFTVDQRRKLAIAAIETIHRWILVNPRVIMRLAVNRQIQEVITEALKVKIVRQSMAESSLKPEAVSRGASAFWHTAMEDVTPAMLSSLVLKDMHLAALRLARLLVNQIGTTTNDCSNPLQYIASSALNEKQIENHIKLMSARIRDIRKSAVKWHAPDRIRHFSFKKQRIITLIEMPRFTDSEMAALRMTGMSFATPPQQYFSPKLKSKARTFSPPNPFSLSNPQTDHKIPKPPVFPVFDCLHETSAATVDAIAAKYPFPKPIEGTKDESPKPTVKLPFRVCDVIVLVRDMFGKYCWEVSGVFDDLKKVPPPRGECEPRPGDKYTFVPKIKTTDKFGQGIADAQQLAVDCGFASKTASEHSLATAVPNMCECKEPYWSSAFIAQNWSKALGSQKSVVRLKRAFKEQRKTEVPLYKYYEESQRKPPQRDAAIAKAAHETKFASLVDKWTVVESASVPPFTELNGILSSSMPPELPNQEDAATFVHSRRLLSTLGLLRWNSASTSNRDLEALDVTCEFLEFVDELDRMPLLNAMSCAVLIHDASDDSMRRVPGGGSASPPPPSRRKSVDSLGLVLNDNDMLSNGLEAHSSAFDRFVRRMAPDVSLSKHVGFSTGLTVEDCSHMPYWADAKDEMAVYIPSRMAPTMSFTRRRQLYLSNAVRIVWSTSRAPIFLSTKFSTSALHPDTDTPVVYIRITTLQMGLFRVSIHGDLVLPWIQGLRHKGSRQSRTATGGTATDGLLKAEGEMMEPMPCTQTPLDLDSSEYLVSDLQYKIQGLSFPATGINKLLVGPLVDGMVVSEELLPQLVRQTVVNASRLISKLVREQKKEQNTDTIIKREKLIHRVSCECTKFSERDSQVDYIKHFFTDCGERMKGRRSKTFSSQSPPAALLKKRAEMPLI